MSYPKYEDVDAALAAKYTPHDGYSDHPLTLNKDDDQAGDFLGSDYDGGYREAWEGNDQDDDGMFITI